MGRRIEPLLKDVQNEVDERGWEINQVGVKDVHYPITVLDKKNKQQATVATINAYVHLPHHFRGTHMSRFIEILEKYRDDMAVNKLETILVEMKKSLKAKSSFMEISFPYFIEKTAPVSKSKSLMEYKCKFIAEHNDHFSLTIELKVPITTLCPCSKAISSRGAHNQRGTVTLTYRTRKLIWIEDLIKAIEKCASSQLYTLIKRPDERYVTEEAYDHPAFVEDVVRNVAIVISDMKEIEWFKVECDNDESIHNHNAYAMIYSKPADMH